MEAREGDARTIIARLSAAGFPDLSRDGLLVLAAMTLGSPAVGDLAQRLGITEAAATLTIDTLIQSGYLRTAVVPDSGPATTAPTERARAAGRAAVGAIVTARWADFPFRPGDIVISTPLKCGTTWAQMMCALLALQTPGLPAPLTELSPWLDWQRTTRDEVFAQLAAQEHRRFIKTHTPLNEMALHSQVTYIVVARHPLDAAVSLCHQEYLQRKGPHRPSAGQRDDSPAPGQLDDRVHEWLLRWIDSEDPSPVNRDSLPSVVGHLADAWARCGAPNVVLLHYDDLAADLEGEMRCLATRLAVTVPEEKWPDLVEAATFKQMRAAADQLQPLPGMGEKDQAMFFRRGTSGAGRELLTAAELARYYSQAARIAPPDLLAWLHRDGV
jgi:aryl sulfotransferase